MSTKIGKPTVAAAWMIILALWGIPALVVGFVIASLPSKFHLIALSISTGILIVFLVNMHGGDGWPKLPSLLYVIVPPVVVTSLIPIGIVRLVRSREDS